MLNSHQILKGARTKGGIKTYVDAEYVGVPTAAVNVPTTGIDITGAIELDGVEFALGNFDASALNTVLVDGDYILSAVPAYDEPADRAAAEAAGLNYFVDYNTPLNEAVVHYFLPSALEAEIAAAGGYNTVYKNVAMGAASGYEVQLFNRYSDQLERLSDPRYTGQLLEPVGVEYVCTRVFAQDNRSKKDALLGLTNAQLELFKATQGYVAAERVVDTTANIAAAYDTVLAKIKRAYAYGSLADANADLNGVEIRLDYANGDTLAAPVDLDGVAIPGVDATHIAVFEYYQPTYMSRGHEGREFGIFDLYEKGDALSLGRINPIYMARDMEVARTSAGRGMPLPALTKYAYPLPVAKFTKADGPVLSAVSVYTPGKLDLV